MRKLYRHLRENQFLLHLMIRMRQGRLTYLTFDLIFDSEIWGYDPE